jgi:hypothetical protein
MIGFANPCHLGPSLRPASTVLGESHMSAVGTISPGLVWGHQLAELNPGAKAVHPDVRIEGGQL